MDKDLLRIVIIAIGATVIIGMVLWWMFKNKKSRRGIDFYDKGNPLDNIDDSLILSTDNDEFDIVSLGSALDENFEPDPITVASDAENNYEPEPEPEPEIQQQPKQRESIKLPSIIQFSVIASTDEGFNGERLVEVFGQVGLEYGSMKIFERVDDQRRVDFAVASMVEPGTFPADELSSFSSPGIVFFIQPSELDEPAAIFDDFIQTIDLIATELNGIKLDHNRQALTRKTIQLFRKHLSS